MREESVLLAFVEAMDFIDEQDRSAAGIGADDFGVFHCVTNVFYTGQNGGQGNEFCVETVGHQSRQRRFAHTWRSP